MSIVTCPSGLVGEIRDLQGKEAKLLTDRKAGRDGTLFDKILGNCWLKTTDSSIYKLPDGVRMDWDKALIGDRIYALLQMRIETFGPEYSFPVQCAEEACRHKYDWVVNLSELPVKAFSDEAKTAFLAGNRFETRLPKDGRTVWFKLKTGEDEKKTLRVVNQGNADLLLFAVYSRIVEIQDVEDKDKMRFLEAMSMRDLTALLNKFDETDGGVETNIDIECPKCWSQEVIQLPFERTFFLPKEK